jgi:hypothetical protein
MSTPTAARRHTVAIPDGTLADTISALTRAFQRQLARRPTTLQRTLIDHAATLTAKAAVAANDPSVALTDVVRLDRAAARARAEMQAAFDRKPAPAAHHWGLAR